MGAATSIIRSDGLLVVLHQCQQPRRTRGATTARDKLGQSRYRKAELETQSGEAEPVSAFGCAQTQMASFLCGYPARAGSVHAFLPAERSGGAWG